MLMEYDPVASIALGSGGLLLCIIIVGMLPECVFSVLDEVRGFIEVILIRKITPVCMFIHAVRVTTQGKGHIAACN